MSKSRDIADSAATINFIDNLTSSAQSQIDAKAPIASPVFTGAVTASSFVGDGSTLTGVGSEIQTVIRTSNIQLTSNNNSNFIDITSGTFSQTFDSAATLGNGWFCYIRNSGIGDITLSPDGSETIDGLTSFKMYPQEMRLIQSDGTNLVSTVLKSFYKTFTSSTTFTKPPGYTSLAGMLWGGGGGGGKRNSYYGTGGGGGACHLFNTPSYLFSASCSVVIGAGGAGVSGSLNATGSNGGFSSFDSKIYAYGGGGGLSTTNQSDAYGGGGGGLLTGANLNAAGRPHSSLGPGFANGLDDSGFGGAFSDNSRIGYSYSGGGCGGPFNWNQGGPSVYGGGGGGGNTNYPGGISTFGGNGGAYQSNGIAPAGGGGGSKTDGQASGSGARGELRIWGVV